MTVLIVDFITRFVISAQNSTFILCQVVIKMGEKRFFTTLANDEYTLIQKKGNPRSTYLKYSEVVDLLNKLYEENEQMKKQLEQIPKSIREVWLE